jgi:hypothetical protein
MSKSSLALAGTFAVALAFAGHIGCSQVPQLTVTRLNAGEKPQPVVGASVRISRPPVIDYGKAREGFFAIRTIEEWRALFDGDDKKAPGSCDFARCMVFAAASRAQDVQSYKITRIVDATNTLHVFARETLRGEGCKRGAEDSPAVEVIVADRIDKPVQFHVESERGLSCGAGPAAKVVCRVSTAATWQPEVKAQPGDTIECEATLDATGAFAVVDKSWHFAESPAGTTAKLSFAKEGMRVSYQVDLFGAYRAAYAVADDSGRKGTALGTAVVLPPNPEDVFVQLAWAGFDASDDPSTFPRMQLIVTDAVAETKEPEAPPPPKGKKPAAKAVKAPAPPPPKECSLSSASKPDFCEIRAQGVITHLHIKGSKGRKFAMGVHYTDERVDGGPYVCLRTFVGGKRALDLCDRKHRADDERWAAGVIDGNTGNFELPPVSADAGAPDAAAP